MNKENRIEIIAEIVCNLSDNEKAVYLTHYFAKWNTDSLATFIGMKDEQTYNKVREGIK